MTTADGRGVVYRQRDRQKTFELLRTSLRLDLRIALSYRTTRRAYRRAHSQLSSSATWQSAIFDTLVEPADR